MHLLLFSRLTICTADLVQRLEAPNCSNGQHHEGVIYLRDVDLPPDSGIGLDDLEAGEAAQGHGLSHDGESCSDHRLHQMLSLFWLREAVQSGD